MSPRRSFAATSLFGHPWRFLLFPVRYWNWKAALLSVLIRSLAYIFAGSRHGFGTGLRAAAIEAMYVALTAGFFAALQQGALRLRPRAAATFVVVAAVPLLAQLCDYSLQHAAGTPNARATSLGLACWALLSAAFHLHLMRHGAMIVGAEARSLAHDFRRIPWLVATFVAAPVVLVMEATGARRTEGDAAENEAAA